jgi:hypothetical protein
MRFGDVDVLVQTTALRRVGSEETSVGSRMSAAYRQAESAIVGIASSVAGTVRTLADHAVRPGQVQVQFGIGISHEGTIVVLSGSVQATLAVTLTYTTAGGPVAPPPGSPNVAG